MPVTVDKWDARFLGLAEHIAGWSKDPSTGVGCVTVDQNNRVVSLGFNGLPRGVQDSEERLETRELKLQITIHAEINAILFAQQSLSGCTLYTWPLAPCAHCAAVIIQSGLARVVSTAPDLDTAMRWKSSNQLARELFEEAGVEYIEC
jgi:dCMP deaminase